MKNKRTTWLKGRTRRRRDRSTERLIADLSVRVCRETEEDSSSSLAHTSSALQRTLISDLRSVVPGDVAPTQTIVQYCAEAYAGVSSGTFWFRDLQRGVVQLLGRSLSKHFAWYLAGPICIVRELYISLLNNNKISDLLHRFSHLGFFRGHLSKNNCVLVMWLLSTLLSVLVHLFSTVYLFYCEENPE